MIPNLESISESVSYIDEEASFKINDRDVKVVRLNKKMLLNEEDYKKFKKELLRYLGLDERGYPLTEDVVVNFDHIIDFRDVKFLSAMFLGALIDFDKKHKQIRGTKPVYLGFKPETYEVFEITRLNECLNVSCVSLEEYVENSVKHR